MMKMEPALSGSLSATNKNSNMATRPEETERRMILQALLYRVQRCMLYYVSSGRSRTFVNLSPKTYNSGNLAAPVSVGKLGPYFDIRRHLWS